MNNQTLIGRILLCIVIVVCAYILLGDPIKALALGAIVIGSCALIRGY